MIQVNKKYNRIITYLLAIGLVKTLYLAYINQPFARAVFVHVLGSFQVYTVPVFDMIEVQLLKRGIDNSFLCRLVYRSIYVVIVTFVAVHAWSCPPVIFASSAHCFVCILPSFKAGRKCAAR